MRRWAALALLIAAAPASAQTAEQRQTAALLGLLLSPAAKPAAGDCDLTPGTTTLAADLLLTLAQIAAHGRIASRCEPAGAATRCDLSIGETPDSDAIWARTYRIMTNAGQTVLVGAVECFTIP
ncbi:MAG TPA: hypothetical protein VL154_16435 [Acetobacteraceae bacterium]|nr:hypothetical protein [Acetobacteraceae bacterium]